MSESKHLVSSQTKEVLEYVAKCYVYLSNFNNETVIEDSYE